MGTRLEFGLSPSLVDTLRRPGPFRIAPAVVENDFGGNGTPIQKDRSMVMRIAIRALILFGSCTLSITQAQSLSSSSKPVEVEPSHQVDDNKLDSYVNAQLRRQHIPGLSLAVVKDGKIVKAKGYGLANVETNTPATPETRYKIASVSKPILAAGIILLVQDGKMGLDDRVSKYLEGTPEAWKSITVRHLITHTSGLVENPPGFAPFKEQPDAEVIKSVYSTPLLFAPGEKYSYSNAAYFALGEIIRQVSGKPWSEFISERILGPAGMTATRTTTTTDIVPNRANGYSFKNQELKNAEHWVALRPSGAFLSTVLDMAKWNAALDSDAIFTPESRKQMWTPTKVNQGPDVPYGLGWGLGPWQGHKHVGHDGHLPGFLTTFHRFVDDKLTVIVMVNTENADVQKIAFNVAGFYVPSLAPIVLKPIPDTEPEITAKVKAIITGFVDGNLDIELFVPGLVPWLKSEGKAGMSKAFRGPGEVQSIELVERMSQDGERAYRYRVAYREDSLLATFRFNQSSKVTSFGVQTE